MSKILAIKSYVCGQEAFDFSELYINSDEKEAWLPINVLRLTHKKFGTLLVNTGCSELLKKNTKDYLHYKQSHKLRFDKGNDITDQLDREDIDPLLVKKVLLTHCSPECCGALPLLPRYELVSGAQVLWMLKTRAPDEDMMRSTLPEPVIPIRAAGIFNGATVLKSYFKWIYDVLGDGSVLGFDLRGHRQGMMGFYFPESKLLYAADAAVDERVLEQELVPTEKMLSMQSDPDEYLITLSTLRRLFREQPDITIRFLHSADIPCLGEQAGV